MVVDENVERAAGQYADPRTGLPASDPNDGTRPIADFEDSVDALQMLAERPFSDPEPAGDGAVGPSLG
jgi:hypothetical protein